MHHGKQVVRPGWQGARATVAVGDEIEGADAGTEFVDLLVGDIPDRHAVGRPADGVVVGDGADAADDAGCQHRLQPAHHFVGRQAELFGDSVIGAWHKRQATLSDDDQRTIDVVDHNRASSFISTKNSRSFGKA